MLVLNAEVLFVGSLVFLHVVSVVRGAVFKGRGREAWLGAPRAPRSEGRRWRRFRPSTEGRP